MGHRAFFFVEHEPFFHVLSCGLLLGTWEDNLYPFLENDIMNAVFRIAPQSRIDLVVAPLVRVDRGADRRH